MRRDFITIRPDEPVSEAFRLMRFARLRHLLVVEDGYLVGILSFRDLQEELLSMLSEGPAAKLPDDSVASAMRARPYAVTPDTPLRDAAARLCGLRVGCLPVVERRHTGPALIGILTESDLLRAAFETA